MRSIRYLLKRPFGATPHPSALTGCHLPLKGKALGCTAHKILQILCHSDARRAVGISRYHAC